MINYDRGSPSPPLPPVAVPSPLGSPTPSLAQGPLLREPLLPSPVLDSPMSPSPRPPSPSPLLIDFATTPQAAVAPLSSPPPFVARQPLFIPSSPSPPPVAGPSHRGPTVSPPPSPALAPSSPAASVASRVQSPPLRRGSRRRCTLQDDTFLDATPAETRARFLAAQETVRQTEAELNRWIGTWNLANDMIYSLRARLTEYAAELRGAEWALDAVDSEDEDFESQVSGSDVEMAEIGSGSGDLREDLQGELEDLRRDAQREP